MIEILSAEDFANFILDETKGLMERMVGKRVQINDEGLSKLITQRDSQIWKAASQGKSVPDDVIEQIRSDSLDFICECIGAPKEYNDGKRAGIDWVLRRLSAAPNQTQDKE